MDDTLFLHKYQPVLFKDFEPDDELLQMLNVLIGMDRLNILFIGPGRTTYMNALIREYYGSSSGSENQSLTQAIQDNILHINSLKDQGIHYYRNDMKTFCQTCSSVKGKKKIIVLDDIDNINEQSQQVFRNYMDKYSQNVHFISSCANPQKVIESLQSRFFIIKIKPLTREKLEKIMQKIIDNENIVMTQEAKEFILNICNNNVKNIINYMEKIKIINSEKDTMHSFGTVDLNLVSNICTNISFLSFEEYIGLLRQRDLAGAVKFLYGIYDKGYSVMDILDNFFLFVKVTNLLTETEKYDTVPIICKYISIFHNIHEDEIELALFSNNLFSKIQAKLPLVQ